MHFSSGQISFIIFFVAAFAAALIFAYRRDKSGDRKYFSGTWKILLAIAIILGAISFILKNLRIH